MELINLTLLNDYLVEGRNAIVRYLVATGKMPTISEISGELMLSEEDTQRIFMQLHKEHALLLDDNNNIRMLWPFSGVPTNFKVIANNITYWANCAWDALGIPAALHADVLIKVSLTCTQRETTIFVKNGLVRSDNLFIHFPLPIKQWYDDLVYT
jgi:hypothetical protein